jgi:predicted MFS family arabinose efflux permease
MGDFKEADSGGSEHEVPWGFCSLWHFRRDITAVVWSASKLPGHQPIDIPASEEQPPMKRGFYTIMSAQFFSSLADNALFVARRGAAAHQGCTRVAAAALVPMFALFYVVLAPFVGAFADALPKGKVMFISNAIKVVGCLMMLFGSHPLMAYAVVGLGAAAYSPAKYGILTELLPRRSWSRPMAGSRG